MSGAAHPVPLYTFMACICTNLTFITILHVKHFSFLTPSEVWKLCEWSSVSIFALFLCPLYTHRTAKVSRDRPRWPNGFRKAEAPDFLDFRHYQGGKVVTLTRHTSHCGTDKLDWCTTYFIQLFCDSQSNDTDCGCLFFVERNLARLWQCQASWKDYHR
jgi:hypothetical protein